MRTTVIYDFSITKHTTLIQLLKTNLVLHLLCQALQAIHLMLIGIEKFFK